MHESINTVDGILLLTVMYTSRYTYIPNVPQLMKKKYSIIQIQHLPFKLLANAEYLLRYLIFGLFALNLF